MIIFINYRMSIKMLKYFLDFVGVNSRNIKKNMIVFFLENMLKE